MNTRNLIIASIVATLTLAACIPDAGGPAAADPLHGTHWVLDTLNGQPPLGGTTPTAEFEGGEIRGSTGCNSYFGAYAAKGSDLTITAVGMTEMACLDPAGVMEQERAFAAALAAVTSYTMSAERLDLLDTSGSVVLTFAAPAPMPEVTLEHTEWSLTTFVEGETASSLLSGTVITLWFEEGRARGSAGCNDYSGPYTLEQGALEISEIVSTKMACSDPSGAMEQEMSYLHILRDVTILERDGNRLTLRTADGRGLVFTAAPGMATAPPPTAQPDVALATPVAEQPAAGVCASAEGDWVTVTILLGIPDPRCAQVGPDQMLRVINGLQETIDVTIGPFEASIKPGREHAIDTPFADYLAPGVHVLQVSPCCGPELLLRADQP